MNFIEISMHSRNKPEPIPTCHDVTSDERKLTVAASILWLFPDLGARTVMAYPLDRLDVQILAALQENNQATARARRSGAALALNDPAHRQYRDEGVISADVSIIRQVSSVTDFRDHDGAAERHSPARSASSAPPRPLAAGAGVHGDFRVLRHLLHRHLPRDGGVQRLHRRQYRRPPRRAALRSQLRQEAREIHHGHSTLGNPHQYSRTRLRHTRRRSYRNLC